MFPNLKAEMARYGITNKMIAEFLGKSESWVENRLLGRTVLPITDAIKIHQKYFKDVPMTRLFDTKPLTNGKAG